MPSCATSSRAARSTSSRPWPGAIADAALAATDPAVVDAVEVRVRKPKAPIDGAFDTVEAALTAAPPRSRRIGPAQLSAGSSPSVTSTSRAELSRRTRSVIVSPGSCGRISVDRSVSALSCSPSTETTMSPA